jgi:pyruvyltransferase
MDKRLKVSFVPSNNWGDLCTPYILRKLNIPFVWTHHLIEKKVVMVGSVILGATKPNSYVWGAGIMYAQRNEINKNGIFAAVRGPKTIEALKKLDIDTNNIVIGDPANILPKLYKPKVEKKYKLGIISHMVDGEEVKNFMQENKHLFENTLIIHSNKKLTNFEEYIDEVNSCEKILSTSLHGVICAHAYNVPVKWMKLGNRLMGDDVKFYDHFESIGLDIDKDNLKLDGFPVDENIEIKNTNHIELLNKNAENLWNCRPWKFLSDEYYVDLDKENWEKECYTEDFTYNKNNEVLWIFNGEVINDDNIKF